MDEEFFTFAALKWSTKSWNGGRGIILDRRSVGGGYWQCRDLLVYAISGRFRLTVARYNFVLRLESR